MIQKVFLSFSLALISLSLFSQSTAEIQNRAVYNQLEFYFNTQQTDSIYALANQSYKDQTALEVFKNALQYYYQFGNIKDVQPVTFSEGIVGYNIIFDSKKCYLRLAVDSNLRFYLLELQDEPYISQETIEEPEPAPEVPQVQTFEDIINNIAQSYIAGQDSVSLSIGIIDNAKVSKHHFGTAIPSNSAAADIEPQYEIGSISKLFTATLLSYLVEGNVIALDDSIAPYLPDSVKSNLQLQGITFKQLANHTSGLPKTPNNLEQSKNYNKNNPYATYSTSDLYHYLKSVSLLSEPGEEYKYSEIGYGLLGDLIRIITKKSYAENIHEVIATPLGLQNTLGHIDQAPQHKTSKSTAKGNKQAVNAPTSHHSGMAGAQGVKSNLQDLLRFAQYQFKMPESQLENALALTRLFTFYLPPNTDIGLGWNMNMSNDVIYYWHISNNPNSSSYIALVPDIKSAVIVLSNSAKSVEKISQEILGGLIELE